MYIPKVYKSIYELVVREDDVSKLVGEVEAHLAQVLLDGPDGICGRDPEDALGTLASHDTVRAVADPRVFIAVIDGAEVDFFAGFHEQRLLLRAVILDIFDVAARLRYLRKCRLDLEQACAVAKFTHFGGRRLAGGGRRRCRRCRRCRRRRRSHRRTVMVMDVSRAINPGTNYDDSIMQIQLASIDVFGIGIGIQHQHHPQQPPTLPRRFPCHE